MDDLKSALRRELVGNLGVTATFDDDTELFSTGLVDSLSVMDLVAFVEQYIGRSIPPAEITLENFGSISRIVRFAAQLTRAAGS